MRVNLRKIWIVSFLICQHYRGFALVGRCGTGTVRSGKKVHGRTRYFRSEGGSVLEREAGPAFGPANTIEEVARRVAQCV